MCMWLKSQFDTPGPEEHLPIKDKHHIPWKDVAQLRSSLKDLLSNHFLSTIFNCFLNTFIKIPERLKIVYRSSRKVPSLKYFLLYTVNFENILSNPLCTFSFLSLKSKLSVWPNLAHPCLKVYLKWDFSMKPPPSPKLYKLHLWFFFLGCLLLSFQTWVRDYHHLGGKNKDRIIT